MYHAPVMLKESLDGLNIKADGIYVDATFGGGGHSKAIVEQLDGGKLYAFDQDEDAAANVWKDDRLIFSQQNFCYVKNFLKLYKALPVDGLLADLGVSSHQFDEQKRGFSFRFDALLDMRMNREEKITAADVINTYTEEQLSDLFYYYGELKNSQRFAHAIVAKRNSDPIKTTFQLKEAVAHLVPKAIEHKILAMLFQALRIEVNHELDALKTLLNQSLDILKPGGRLVIISYHSLEDRLVKNFMKTGNIEGILNKDFFGNQLSPFHLISKKAVIPANEEIALNNRARSAKLRIAEKK